MVEIFKNVNCTEISTIKQFKKRIVVFYLCCQRVIQHLIRKTVFGLDESKNCTIFNGFNVEDGINSKLHYSKKWQVLLQTDTRTNIRGTSMSTPTTVANAAPEERPNKTTAVAIATSK